MANRLETRLRKLEAVHGTHPFGELETDELTALLIVLQSASAESATQEVIDELLASRKMSREAFEKASEALTSAFLDRLVAHYKLDAAA